MGFDQYHEPLPAGLALSPGRTLLQTQTRGQYPPDFLS